MRRRAARDAARERFADLVALQQRRAARIAYQYLRDVHDADEAVQDAFVKVFTHIASYREDLPFEVWFTRILVNGCLDLRKARSRRLRWVLPATPSTETAPREPVAPEAGPEDRLLAERTRAADRGRRRAAARAAARRVHALPDRRTERARGEPARSASARRPSGFICFAPSADCGGCWNTSESKSCVIRTCPTIGSLTSAWTSAPGATEQQHLASCARVRGAPRAVSRACWTTRRTSPPPRPTPLFTDERLARQRAHILQRVEQESRHGQLISFPAGHAASPTLLRIVRPASRWIAGAAAAGLFIGLLAGHLAHDFTAGRVTPRSARAFAPAEPTHPGRVDDDVGGRVPRPSRDGHRRHGRFSAAAARRPDAARLGGCGAVVPPLIFRKGLDLEARGRRRPRRKLPQRPHRRHQGLGLPLRVRPVHHPSRARVRVLLRRGPRGRLRLPGAPPVSGPHRLPDRRNHPQPARQRRAARRRASAFSATRASRSTRSRPADVVILPAFGVTIEQLMDLERRGCTLVDTTCGSVLNVWKNVKRYAEDGFTSVIHGKYWHEETQRHRVAGAARGLRAVSRRPEPGRGARRVRLHPIRRRSARRSSRSSRAAASPGFDPDQHLGASRLRQPDDDAELGVARDRRDVSRRDSRSLRRCGALPPLSRVRHDLQRDPGPPGRRQRAARRAVRSI